MLELKKTNMERLWVYFLIIYSIFSSASIYVIVYGLSKHATIGTIIFFGVTFFMYYAKKLTIKKDTFFYIVIALILILLCPINGNNMLDMTYMLMRFVFILLGISAIYEKHKTINIFEMLFNVIFVIAVIIFICYLLFDFIAPSAGLSYITTRDEVVNNVATKVVYSVHYNFYYRWNIDYKILGLSIPRCSGFCWEPGQYQSYLNYALFYLLFMYNKGKKLRKILFILICIISTVSIMGILIAFLLICISLLKSTNKTVRFLLFIALSVIGYFLISVMFTHKISINEKSYNGRMEEITYIIDVIFENPLGKPLINNLSSNGLIRYLYQTGYIGIFSILAMIKSLFKSNIIRNNLGRIGFFVWVLLSTLNEPIESHNFLYLILALIILYDHKNDEYIISG